MLDELIVSSECEAADDRMQPVCPNDEIETTRTRTPESDIHSYFILGKSLNGITEDVIRIVGTSLMKDSCEIATRNLNVLGRNR